MGTRTYSKSYGRFLPMWLPGVKVAGSPGIWRFCIEYATEIKIYLSGYIWICQDIWWFCGESGWAQSQSSYFHSKIILNHGFVLLGKVG